MTTYVPEGELFTVKDHILIFKRYYNKNFMIEDLIAWFPIVFFLDNSHLKFFRIFFLLKVVRIGRMLRAFDIKAIVKRVKYFTTLALNWKIANDPSIAEDTLSDHNSFDVLMKWNHGLQIFKIVMVIMNIS